MRIESIEITKINPAKYNPRKDLQPGDPEYEKLKKSIQEFDIVEPLVWNERTGNLVGGHQRLKILEELGHTEAEVSVVDMDDQREKALNIALNKISGEWDMPKLKDLLEELDDGMFDMDLTGFDMAEIEDLMTQFYEPDEIIEDEVPDLPEEPITKPGDLWILGRHRLLCGDSTVATDVDRLMGGEKANVTVTSPPYAMQRKDDYGGVTAEDYPGWFYIIAKNVFNVLSDDGSFFVNIKEHVEDGQRSLYVFKTIIGMVEGGWRYVDQLIWTKVGVPGGWNNRLRNDFEPVHFFTKKDHIDWMVQFADIDESRLQEIDTYLVDMYEDVYHFVKNKKIKFYPRAVGKYSDKIRVSSKTNEQKGKSGNISVSGKFKKGIARAGNVLSFPGNQDTVKHSAVFPVRLPAFFIKLTTSTGGTVYEPFSGGGTTIIAAEQLGRQCFAMELLPKYCDVAVQRWENLTGKKAELSG